MTERQITSRTGKDYLPQAVDLLSSVFKNDPVLTYMLSSLDETARYAFFPRYFHSILTAAVLNKASISEIDDWKACAVLIPPGERVDNPRTWFQAGLIPLLWNMGFSGSKKTLFEYGTLTDGVKERTLGKGSRYYYVFFAGTREDARKQGFASDIIKQYQEKAANDNVPLWLEATTSYSRDLYARLGFKLIDEVVLGKGSASPDGLQMKGGEGVRLWAMVWESPRHP
ncbi:putative n-acetyltransferase [Phlyctema vagabunda]|uniref:N-acetyltransferase n=1 Tax=Phlyctema vagabunda TaxID=108571 RepID=A0ABR4P6X0_9HELO